MHDVVQGLILSGTMCELLGLSSNAPATVNFSLPKLAEHGAVPGTYADGWGVGYYEGLDVRLFEEIRINRKLKAVDVIDVLSDLFILRGVPGHIRSDNGPEFVAKAVQEWITAVGAKTAHIEPGSPWENGYIESFNARLRDELLNGEIFYTLREAQIVIESWRRHYNAVRPHASLNYKAPAPEVFVPAFAAWPATLRRPAPPATLAQPPALN